MATKSPKSSTTKTSKTAKTPKAPKAPKTSAPAAKSGGRFTNFIAELSDAFRGTNEMSLNVKKVVVAFMSLVFFISLLIVAWVEGGRSRVLSYADAVITKENADCVSCHDTMTPGLVQQWKKSRHSHSGVGCFSCHEAQEGDADAKEHYGGTLISPIVSPKDCSTCHLKEFEQFSKSHHARGGTILGSLDNVLAEVVEGHVQFDANGQKTKESPAAVSGCKQCHGSEIKILEDGSLDPDTWPNTGIGRINPDGSKGACSSCHLRHNFSIAQARQPESCGKCHMGPDHPHIEIYMESKHGIGFIANRAEIVKEMAEKEWVPGVHYEAGPTCSTCHMGATKTLESTHDVGARISWNLRPAISEKIDSYAKAGEDVKPWDERRSDMQNVCLSCHAPGWINNWYTQYDDFVELYNDKFARPATELYNMIRARGLITSMITFDDEIEFTYFYLWHHEGRRARHGASMMGPDYAQWHGLYEVSENFYQKFIPQLKEVIAHGKAQGGASATAAAAVEKRMNEILNSPMHNWYTGKMSAGERKAREQARKEFLERYKK